VLIGWWWLRDRNLRLAFLAVMSYVFYAYWDWRFVGLMWVSTGIEQLVIPIASAALVRAANPVPELLERWGTSPARAEDAMAYLWASDEPTWTVRFFFVANRAVREDPATGSACANLGGWFSVIQPRIPIARSVSQGEAVKRPSTLFLNVEWQESNPRIFVGGDVIELGRGTLDL